MPSLEAVWRAVFPQARLHPAAAPAALEQPVGWVRVLKARVPAFDALDHDDLAVLPRSTLASLSALAVEPATVVQAVADAQGCGVVVISDADEPDRLAEDVAARAARAGLGSFLLGGTDISALERSTIAYILNGQAELERRTAALESELERAALGGGGPQALAATISHFLARPVAIEAGDGSLIAVHAPAGAGNEPAGVTNYLRQRRGAALRVPLPPVTGEEGVGRPPGTLVLLGSGSVSELERLATMRVAALVALEVARGQPAAERPPDALPADGPPWVVLVARQIDAAVPATIEEREELRRGLRRLAPARRLALRGDATSVELRLVAAIDADDPRGLAVARRVAEATARPVAVSRPFAERAERPLMEADARATLEAVERMPAAETARLASGGNAMVALPELAPAYRLVGALAGLPGGRREAEALLAPLLTGRPRRDGEALATLRAVLDHAGLAEAAAALGVHRNTLAYRLSAIEARTGWRLTEPLLRVALAIAIRIVQSDQEPASDARRQPALLPPPRR